MKRTIPVMLALLLTIVAAGCQKDHAATVLEPPPRPLLDMAGSTETNLKDKSIDADRKVTTDDHVVLDVWVIKARDEKGKPATKPARGTVVLIHDLGQNKGSCLPLGERLAKMGYDVVLPDLRGHGDSGGEIITYGAREHHDIKTIMNKLLAEKLIRKPFYVYGVGLGGAIAIEYAAIDPRCEGVLAVAPPKDALLLMRGRLAFEAPFISDEDFQAVVTEAAKSGNFNLDEASAVKAAEKLKCPLLLVHGLIDLNIPLENSEAILAAAPEPKKLIILKPGREQGWVLMNWEPWMAEKIDMIATTGLKEPETKPAKK